MSEMQSPYKTKKYHDPLDDVLDRPIAFNPAFKKLTGSTVAALMLSQAWYWTKRVSIELDGWFYKTQEEWEEETGLTRSEQETARKHLRELGIMEDELRGIPARLYYRIDKQKVYSLLGIKFAETPQTGMQESDKQVRDIPANINIESETTSEITTPEKQISKKHIPEGLPQPTGDSLGDWLNMSAALEKKNAPAITVIETLTKELRYNFPLLGENHGFDGVVKQIIKDGRDVVKFCEWALAQKRDPHWYHIKPDSLWGDWPQAFSKQAEVSHHPGFITVSD